MIWDNILTALDDKNVRKITQKGIDMSRFRLLFPYLKEIEKKYPVSWFPATGELEGYEGMTGGTRYSDPGDKKEILLALGMEPKREVEARRHEGTHGAIQESRNWRDIIELLGPSWMKELGYELGSGHVGEGYMHPDINLRHQLWVEEMMNRMLTTRYNPYEDRKDELLTKQQQSLLPYLLQHIKYGPQAGSIWGPELPEEYEGKKGIDIYNFAEFLKGR